jgi:hypothetical protein
MEKDPVRAYLEHLRDHPSQREKLRDAVSAECVAAGEAAGYHFTVEQFEKVLHEYVDFALRYGG